MIYMHVHKAESFSKYLTLFKQDFILAIGKNSSTTRIFLHLLHSKICTEYFTDKVHFMSLLCYQCPSMLFLLTLI